MILADEVAGAVAYVSKPAVVDGDKAVEAALTEGMFPIIDKTIDVFAVPSTDGMYMCPVLTVCICIGACELRSSVHTFLVYIGR